MENEILENGSAPETEELQQSAQTQETEVVEAVADMQETVETPPAEEKKNITDVLNTVADKGKELYANRAAIWEKAKEIPQKLKDVPKKIWMLIGGGVAALIVIIVVLSMLGNTYKTPIKAAEKLLSSKSVSQIINRAPALLNGFGEDEAKTLIGIAKKSDQYKDNIEDIEDMFDEIIEGLEDNVGKNYKIQLKVTDKEKLEKDDLKRFRNQLRNIAELADELDDMDRDDYADMADDLGITKAQAKKVVKTLKSFCKDCKSAKVQKGFELTVEVKMTGKELDEPMELEIPVNVIKVDGRWVPDVFSLVDNVMDSVGGILGSIGGMSGLLGGF